jgi:hypothetical protein
MRLGVGNGERALHHPFAILASCGLLVLAQAIFALTGHAQMPDAGGMLAGPDSYMRLLRVEAWAQSGAWGDAFFPYSNAPYGETLHWTRPFDFLLLIGARPLGWLVGFRDGLYWWGVLIGPVLQLASLLALSWATRPTLSNRGFLFMALLFITQPAIAEVFEISRPDHHSLLAFLFVLGVALMLRGLTGRLRYCGAAGLVSGVAIWVSIEGAAAMVVTLGVLGGAWLARGDWYLRGVVWFLAGVAIVLCAALPIEYSFASLTTPAYDRVSFTHWSLAGVTFVAAAIVVFVAARIKTPTLFFRLIGGFFIVAAPLSVAVVAFPKFFGGPFVDVDPALFAIWFDHIDEVQPLSASDVAIYLGPSMLGGAYLVGRIWVLRDAGASGAPAGASGTMAPHLYIGALLLVFTPLAMAQARWSIYPAIAALAPWTYLLRAAFRYQGAWRAPGGVAVPLRAPLFLAVLAAPVTVGAVLFNFDVSDKSGPTVAAGAQAEHKCPWGDFAPVLQRLEAPGGVAPIILGFVHRGPEMMYRSGVRVVGTPYHRNASGIRDTNVILTTETPDDAHRIVRRRSVDYFAFCRGAPESKYFQALSTEALYRRLYERRLPGWLREQPLPESLGSRFQLLKVIKE